MYCLFWWMISVRWTLLFNDGLHFLRNAQHRPHCQRGHEVHPWLCHLSGMQSFQGQHPHRQISHQPWDHSIHWWPFGVGHRNKGRHDSHLPLSMKEIYGHPKLPWRKRCGMPATKPFLRASGIWGARAPGPPIMGLKLTKAGLMPAVHEAVLFSPTIIQTLKDGPQGRIPHHPAWSGNCQLY